MQRLLGVFCCAALCARICGVQAAEYEVSVNHPKASDDGPGTAAQPWKTIARAAGAVSAGDTVTVRGGVYREYANIKADGTAEKPIRLVAAPGEWVVMTGADLVKDWKPEGGNAGYSVAWPHKFNAYSPQMTHPGDEYHRLIGRCEQAFVDGFALRQVLNREQLAPGTFFADTVNRRLFACDAGARDLNKVTVEASVRSTILRVEGRHVQLEGFRFRYAANSAQHGAVVLAGNHGIVRDCVFESMNSSGAQFVAEDLQVIRCVFRDNGQLGFGANRAHRLLLTGCLIENNNTKNFDRGWEAGGNKLVLCRGAILEKSIFARNHGDGVWFDIGNEDCIVRNCLIADNDDAGIFYEISYGLQARDNTIIGNGFAPTKGAWGAQSGISLSSSPGCVIERNLLIGNREGFDFREQYRSTPTIEERKGRPVWNHDEVIRNNLIALNRDVQVGGWFDVPDDRHWPVGSAMRDRPAQDKAQVPEGHPTGSSLEKLNFVFEDNLYYSQSGQPLVRWGVTWKKNRSFRSLAEFQSELKIDRGGRVEYPEFKNLSSRDFRLTPEALKRFQNQYPRGDVPGAVTDRLP